MKMTVWESPRLCPKEGCSAKAEKKLFIYKGTIGNGMVHDKIYLPIMIIN